MRKIILLTFIITFVSCKKETEDHYGQPKTDQTAVAISGQELFEGKGTCTACHLPDQKVIGPSITEIAKIYKEKKGSIVSFLKEESEPIVDPSQYETMKTNFAITKLMSDEELKALEEYIYSFSK
ncbi:c-type cytochrome [Flavobacterium sp. J49]|uniref:c-type cytochrome n=1 Tax=Flavobacterium sp. J49 TaxID=2718534 RepID=UPI0015943A62|nr:c-type cytochrome [Flavobacterium sp. J49]MBF6641534.1 c-type cytochrome [Flavobacterium sp. J49]NIC02781.1 c-type cytochrome [Flavobacterium sp. J49]